MLAVAFALARVVVEPDTTPPSVTDQAVLLMKQDAAACTAPDAGVPDAGTCAPSTITLVNAEQEGLFDALAAISDPVIHIHEIDVPDPSLGRRFTSGARCGGGYSSPPPPVPWQPPVVVDAAPPAGPIQQIGPYDVAQARPSDATALAAWLTQLGYTYAQADLDAVAPYLARNYVVVAVRVAIDGPLDRALVPLALTSRARPVRSRARDVRSRVDAA